MRSKGREFGLFATSTYNLFNDFVSSSNYCLWHRISANLMRDKLERMWKEAVVVYFNLELFWNK
jgi:hypothetical protein